MVEKVEGKRKVMIEWFEASGWVKVWGMTEVMVRREFVVPV